MFGVNIWGGSQRESSNFKFSLAGIEAISECFKVKVIFGEWEFLYIVFLFYFMLRFFFSLILED